MSEYFYNIYDTIKTMLSGMSLTLHHLRKKKDLVATLQYPNEKWPQPERSIGFDHSEYNLIRSRLHVDIDDCIGCLQCERACPVDCIKIDTIKPPKDSDYDCGKTSHDTQKKMIVPRFTIDMSECMYCNLCVYPCPEECIYMVGGPNEPKHDIDYEFSKYVKHDLVFEFSNSTDQDIIDIGAQSYLDKRKEKEDNLLKGQNLEGIIEEESDDSKKDEDKKPSNHVDPAFVLFKNVADKMSRGIAKKAFTSAKRNNLDMNGIADKIIEAINSYNKMSNDMEKSISEIRNFKYPEDESDKIENTKSDAVSDELLSNENEKNTLDTLFDIKTLNDIEDKMVRGSLKKIYMAGKRSGNNSNNLIDEMLTFLKDNDKEDNEIISLLNNLKKSDVSDTNESESIPLEEKKVEDILFDIKKLNDIEDKMLRGTAKKIYMGGKRAGKNSKEIIADIKNSINESGKMNTSLEELLEGIL